MGMKNGEGNKEGRNMNHGNDGRQKVGVKNNQGSVYVPVDVCDDTTQLKENKLKKMKARETERRV